jgi:hypothetical protein
MSKATAIRIAIASFLAIVFGALAIVLTSCGNYRVESATTDGYTYEYRRSSGVINGYGRREKEWYDKYAHGSQPSDRKGLVDLGWTDFVRANGHPRYHLINSYEYYWDDARWPGALNKRINDLRAKARKEGKNEDWYVDVWNGEDESNFTED